MKNFNVRMVDTKIYLKVPKIMIRIQNQVKPEYSRDDLDSLDQKAINALVKIYFNHKYSNCDRISDIDNLRYLNGILYEEYSNPVIKFALRHSPEVGLFLIRINRVIKNRNALKRKKKNK